MEEEQTRALSLRAAYRFAAEHGLEREAEEIRNMPIDWNLKTTSSVRRGNMVDLLEKHGLLDAFKDQYWMYGKTSAGAQKQKWYLSLKARYEDFLAGRGEEEGPDEEGSMEETEQQFAVESDLRDFLANNISIIESGHKLSK